MNKAKTRRTFYSELYFSVIYMLLSDFVLSQTVHDRYSGLK